MAEKIRTHVFVSGRVQGVFFRSGTRKKARELGLKGWVRNLDDGRVEAVLEGGKEAMERMMEWLKHGPPLARVDTFEKEIKPFRDEFQGFQIGR